MLNAAFALPEPPVTVVGGSLVARNEALLLERYPNLLVARADGEATIEGLLAHWHGDVAKEDIPALGYNGAARGGGLAITRRRTAKPVARHAAGDILPELDLLPATFERHGVAQLEASRGCTNFCSFCPRGRKGTRFGAPADRLPWILGEVRKVFDLCPDVSRTCTWSMRSSSAAAATPSPARSTSFGYCTRPGSRGGRAAASIGSSTSHTMTPGTSSA